jgi:hypothetical protein
MQLYSRRMEDLVKLFDDSLHRLPRLLAAPGSGLRREIPDDILEVCSEFWSDYTPPDLRDLISPRPQYSMAFDLIPL